MFIDTQFNQVRPGKAIRYKEVTIVLSGNQHMMD